MITYPKVLVVSHNVFSKNTNMGKTMETYFKGWDKDKLAQLYFHSEIPTSDVCLNYYRFTDVDAFISSVNRGHVGSKFTKKDIQLKRISSVDTGKITNIYNFGRRRLPLTYFLRDYLWYFSAWKSKDLCKWITDFSPEIIFLASGDYEFSYIVAKKIADNCNIPLVVCCFDDYYIYNKNKNIFLGEFRQKHFMKTVNKVLSHVSCIFTINELMSEAYTKMFNKKCPVLYTGTDVAKSFDFNVKKKGIVYLGGLGLGRNRQLIDIGRALKSSNNSRIPKYIDVYSGETNPKLSEEMTMDNGVKFHGQVPASEVEKIIKYSEVVVHTESFDAKNRQRVMFSLSTKIPESLASGTCMLAYGPRDVASIDYLIKNNAAFVISDKSKLTAKLEELFVDDKLRESIVKNAVHLAARNHNSSSIPNFVRENLVCAIHNWRES